MKHIVCIRKWETPEEYVDTYYEVDDTFFDEVQRFLQKKDCDWAVRLVRSQGTRLNPMIIEETEY